MKTFHALYDVAQVILKASEDELRDILKKLGYANVDETMDAITDFEEVLATLLEDERTLFLKKVATGQSLSEAVAEIRANILKDVLATKVAEEAESLLRPFVETVTNAYMEILDSDVPLGTLSDHTDDFLKEWSESLGKYLEETSHNKLDNLIASGIDDGIDMVSFSDIISANYTWSRERARRVAQTEVLTSHSYCQYEAYKQSPAVEGKKWKHSGGKGIDPRPAHVDLHGTVVGVDEKFTIASDTGVYHALMPRDVTLPPSERLFCHCTMGPAVNNDILGLTAEEKLELRDKALEDWNSAYKK